ncbi:MAG: hypothetical protein KDK39_16665 [Leptospiraceae bacterium]|nr:hypothetical protein [Leptospiraceae bacterium]
MPIWDFILLAVGLVSAVNHFYLGIFGLAVPTQSRKARLYFSGILLAGAWWCFWLTVSFSQLIEPEPRMLAMSMLLSGYFGPLIYLYVRTICQPGQHVGPSGQLILLFGSFGTLLTIIFLTMDRMELQAVYTAFLLRDYTRFAFLWFLRYAHSAELLLFILLSVIKLGETYYRTRDKTIKVQILYIALTVAVGTLSLLFANILPVFWHGIQMQRIAPLFSIPGAVLLYISFSNTNKYIHRLEVEKEQERQGIMRDIHDHLGAKLTDAFLLSQKLQQKDTLAPADLDQLGEAVRLGLDMLREKIDLLHDLESMRENFIQGLQIYLVRRYTKVGRTIDFQLADEIGDSLPMSTKEQGNAM